MVFSLLPLEDTALRMERGPWAESLWASVSPPVKWESVSRLLGIVGRAEQVIVTRPGLGPLLWVSSRKQPTIQKGQPAPCVPTAACLVGQMGHGCPIGKAHMAGLAPTTGFVATPSPDVCDFEPLGVCGYRTLWAPLLHYLLPLGLS